LYLPGPRRMPQLHVEFFGFFLFVTGEAVQH
jgi:hypothetical protein